MAYAITLSACSVKVVPRDVAAEAEAESGSAKNMPLPLPHHSKKHTVNNLLDNIFYSIY